MDTDGYMSNNVLGFSSVSPQLVRDVQFTVQSLGGVARFQHRRTTWTHNGEKKEGVAYHLTIAMPGDMNPFHLKRKADLCKQREKYPPVRAFKSITYIGKKAAQCIAVDSPDRLYVTDECILTHNTVQTLALLQHDWSDGYRRPTLLICPTSVIENWRKEAARFTPELPVLIHHGSDRRRSDAFAAAVAGQALVISSYALLHRDLELLRSVAWRGVVLDEAQNVKNPETKQARAARALSADYCIALTGTPVENHVGDLWSLMELLNPGLLGSQTDFKRRFFLPIQVTRDEAAAARLKQLTGPFILRRVKTDRAIIADLPEKLEMKVFCTLTKEQASLYAAVLKDLDEPLEEAEGIQRKGMILATLTKLKQICNHPAQFLGDGSAVAGRSGKLARLEEMLEEVLATGDRALLFSQFAEMGGLLQHHLQRTFGREVLFLHGGVPRARRNQMVERFQSAGNGPPIFILSLKAGGTGLNLTAANHVFHFDRWWNPAVENQATDRAFRIGQCKAVQVHKLLCAGTLEERIDAMIESKQGIAAQVVGTGEGWLTELSTAQLRDLLALRVEALDD
jgi:SNF2 family DNA or RNA helicase